MIEQRSAGWLEARLGHATASRAEDILAGKTTVARGNYIAEKIIERMNGVSGEDGYINKYMERGIEKEPYARAAYIDAKDLLSVAQIGFRRHPLHKWVGCSVDSEVEPGVGGNEIKCPTTANHIRTLLYGMPAKHRPQVQFIMWVMGWKWVDFVSFDDRMPKGLQLYIQRVERDDKYIDEVLEPAVLAFLEEVETLVCKLKGLSNG